MTEGKLEISEQNTMPGLFLFADIVDSSKYSSVLGYTEYARRLLAFQSTFLRLAQRYFPGRQIDRTTEYYSVEARGDEGRLFFCSPDVKYEYLIGLSVDFLMHLKAQLRFADTEEPEGRTAPHHIGLGAGIHVGKIAFATALRKGRSIVESVEGYSINYAKRVESCSREGRYSRIFLSKDAAQVVQDIPLVLRPITTQMKGIDECAEVYELQSGLFSGLQIDVASREDQVLIEKVKQLARQPMDIEEPWIKSVVVSILEHLSARTLIRATVNDHQTALLHLVWHNPAETDPLLLYLRAKEFSRKGQHTQQARYLRDIVGKYPGFIHARRELVRACWAIASAKPVAAELIFARDLAQEFMEHFPHLLSPQDKKFFADLLKKTGKKRSPLAQ